jgi:YbbR domain-containing protein
VTRLAPSKITVELEELVIKTLSLLPVIKGEPQPGYIIDDISLEPRSVAVKGPQSQLRNLDILWTEPVDVTKLKETVSLKTRPVLPDVSLSLVDPVEVRAQLGIVEKTIIREFTGVPIETQPGGDPRPQVRLDPTSVTLVVKGPVNAMADLAVGSNLTARVNMAGLEPGTHERMIIVNAPPRVEVLKVEPRLARITVLEGEPDGTEPPPEGTLAPLKRPVLPEIPAPGEPAALPGHAAPSDGGPIDKTKGGKVEP